MLDISKLRLTQPSLAGSWAELGKNSVDKREAAHQNIKSLEKISAEKTANNEVLKNEIS